MPTKRDPDAMAPWQRETYPAISRQAKWDEGEIYFLGESDVRVNAVYGTTWGQETAAGRIGARPRQSTSATSAVGGSVQRCQSWEAV